MRVHWTVGARCEVMSSHTFNLNPTLIPVPTRSHTFSLTLIPAPTRAMLQPQPHSYLDPKTQYRLEAKEAVVVALRVLAPLTPVPFKVILRPDACPYPNPLLEAQLCQAQ